MMSNVASAEGMPRRKRSGLRAKLIVPDGFHSRVLSSEAAYSLASIAVEANVVESMRYSRRYQVSKLIADELAPTRAVAPFRVAMIVTSLPVAPATTLK